MSDNPQRFVALLLDWFSRHQRPLPWRRHYQPYHVFISEIMLQQTQMERVVPYFNRWVTRLPDIDSVAEADEDEILKLWEGLGYYSRARNLQRAARQIVADGGIIPADREKLLSLPGIGPYTAHAILSIAFNQDFPVLDANVERLYARLFNLAVPVKSAEGKRFLRDKAAAMLPPGQSRLFNQALMELGALVCLARGPLCAACPVASLCRAKMDDLVAQRPVPVSKKPTLFIEMATGILQRGDRMLIQKRRADDVWANLWEFPGGRLKEGESPGEAVIREFREETGLVIETTEKLISVRHSYMHYRVLLHGFHCIMANNDSAEPATHAAQENRWVTLEELNGFAFPAGHRKLIDYLQERATKRGQKGR